MVQFFRRPAKLAQPDESILVAERYLKLFREHGILVSEIPRFVPQLSLEKLQSAETLLPALTGELLDQAAGLFLARRDWLDGRTEDIYETHLSYKAPKEFFDQVADLESPHFDSVVAFCNVEALNGRDEREQRLALVLREPITRLGDTEVYRYRVFGDQWNWGYWKCRIQLKAMARVLHQLSSIVIPIFRVPTQVVEAIEEGRCIPHRHLQGQRPPDTHLEDYALSKRESAKSQEEYELEPVFEYIAHHDLEKIANDAFKQA